MSVDQKQLSNPFEWQNCVCAAMTVQHTDRVPSMQWMCSFGLTLIRSVLAFAVLHCLLELISADPPHIIHLGLIHMQRVACCFGYASNHELTCTTPACTQMVSVNQVSRYLSHC